MNELALFAGAGGGILGGLLQGWKTVCAVEWDEHAREVLAARQNDGCLEPFPIWDDVQTFDGKPWRGLVDVVSGGFPCQDISNANTKAEGIDGDRSSMWKHMARIVDEVEPCYVFVENSPMLVGRGLARVLGDLATMGYDARWGVVGACDAGAPHQRERIWIVADSDERRRQRIHKRCEGKPNANATPRPSASEWWNTEPGLGRVVDGVADRMDRERIYRLGNGQVPAVVPIAWKLLGENRENSDTRSDVC
jgi:DNA (cytosine-5)-methyltransferase 1